MKKITFSLILSCIAILNTVAQPGALDLSFNPTDKGFGNGDGVNGSVHNAAIQNDGKIIIVGYFNTYNSAPRRCIARLNSNGSLDSSFNPGSGASGYIDQVNIQSDGKIIISGACASYNGTTINYFARLNID